MARVRFGRFKEDWPSMAAFLMSERVGRVSMAAARDIADAAKANMLLHSRTGDTAEGYETRSAVGGGTSYGGPRRAAVVYNEDPGAAANEFGYEQTPERRPLRRAAGPYHTPYVLRGRGWS